MKIFLENFSYPGILALLLLAGLGVPIPEDIPLLLGGYLCAPSDDNEVYASLYFMIPLTLATVLAGDFTIYFGGRRYGQHIPNLPVIRRFLDRKHLRRAEHVFHKHGGKTLFIGRFLPGLRAPIFFTAGAFKIPVWKMLAFDGAAALISVPALVLLGWYFAAQLDRVKKLTVEVQVFLLVGTVVTMAMCVFIRNRHMARRDSSKTFTNCAVSPPRDGRIKQRPPAA